MGRKPTFSDALTSKVKLYKQKYWQRKYYTHKKQVQLNSKLGSTNNIFW